MSENKIHPHSLIGRLSRGNEKWIAAVKDTPGSDVFLLVDAMAHIGDLTARLASTRKHLKEANRALENKAIRLENIGRLMHHRSCEPLPATLRQIAVDQTLRTTGPDAIRAAAARLDGSPGAGTPPEVEKAALRAPVSPQEAAQWFEGVPLPHSGPPTLASDLVTRENQHLTTP